MVIVGTVAGESAGMGQTRRIGASGLRDKPKWRTLKLKPAAIWGMSIQSIFSRLFEPRGKPEREGTASRPSATLRELLLARTPPWDRVPQTFVQLVVDVLGDKGLLDVFILHSVEEGLVARYALICEDGFDERVIRAGISQILCETGNRAVPALAKAFEKGQRDKSVKALMLAGDCFEAAIALELNQWGGYIGLAHTYGMIGKREKSHEYAQLGLSLLAEFRQGPEAKIIALRGSTIIPPNILDLVEGQLRTYLEH